MRKHCRSRVRSRGGLVLNAYSRMVAHFAYAQTANKWTEWNYRTISLRQAQILVAAGEAEPITRMKDGVVQTVGFRAVKPTSWERPSPATLTFGTMVAVGKEALSVRLSAREWQEVVKFRVWPLIGDTRAVAVRPRMTEEERAYAEKLLKSGGARFPKARRTEAA